MRRSAQESSAEVTSTDPDRDRFIDLVRVTSMVVVVVLHWLSVMPALQEGRVVRMGSNHTLAHNEPRDLLGAYDHMVSLGYPAGQMTVLATAWVQPR
ncbi:MAG TPA: hypothetical protein VFE92_01160 [Dermatophilaceae bacterium]|nr:hypothetical protein [Dermatophilaceae bacterium]